ncbi:MAG: hypothetical protein ACJ786_14900 [Catenulispora sp.]
MQASALAISGSEPLTACRCTEGTLSPPTTTTVSASCSSFIADSRFTVAA